MPGISIITSLPNFVTPEQHRELTSSTPSSFAELPAIIYHEERNTAITLDPPLDGITPEDCASGTIYIFSSVLVFMSTSGKGLQVTYPTISLHAISRADLGPSIYCQLDELIDTEEEPTSDEEDAMEMRELRINTRSEESLEPIFEALSQCAALHPDEGDDANDFDDAFVDVDEVEFGGLNEGRNEGLSEAGRMRRRCGLSQTTLAHLEAVITDPQGLLHDGSSDDEETPPVAGVGKEPQLNGVHH